MAKQGKRSVGWFSAGAASAVAMKIFRPDVVTYCDTGSEDEDNARFLRDIESFLGISVIRLKSEVYEDTWDVWERRKYLAGVMGAPCTKALKVDPRVAFQRPDDIHVFGYTYDTRDRNRADAFRENYPDLTVRFPLIEQKLTKQNCLEILNRHGIKPPRVYVMGFSCANCIPCVKATSPRYWALVRKEFPVHFNQMVDLSRKLNVKLTRLKGERAFIDEIPKDHPTSDPIQPECDFLCQLIDAEMVEGSEESTKNVLKAEISRLESEKARLL